MSSTCQLHLTAFPGLCSAWQVACRLDGRFTLCRQTTDMSRLTRPSWPTHTRTSKSWLNLELRDACTLCCHSIAVIALLCYPGRFPIMINRSGHLANLAEPRPAHRNLSMLFCKSGLFVIGWLLPLVTKLELSVRILQCWGLQ